jgi:hypothetical protein
MKKNVGISIFKCLKSAAKNRRANQTARAILSAPTVESIIGATSIPALKGEAGRLRCANRQSGANSQRQ